MLPVTCLIINAIEITKEILSVLKKLNKEDFFLPTNVSDQIEKQ